MLFSMAMRDRVQDTMSGFGVYRRYSHGTRVWREWYMRFGRRDMGGGTWSEAGSVGAFHGRRVGHESLLGVREAGL